MPYLDAAAAVDEGSGEMAVFAVNRSPTEAVELGLRLGGYEGWTAFERLELAGFDPKAVNAAARPDAVVPRLAPDPGRVESGVLVAALPPLSWNVIRLRAPRR